MQSRFIRAWNVMRHVLAVRGLLEWIGWWGIVSGVLAGLVVSVGSILKRLPWPVTVTLGLVAFAAVTGALAAYQVWASKLRAPTIHSAQYGLGEGQYVDVTARVRSKVVDGRLNMQIENENLVDNDPFKGKRKHLVLVYSLRGRTRHTVTVGEHQWTNIPTGHEPR
jgi:hypothetical protein